MTAETYTLPRPPATTAQRHLYAHPAWPASSSGASRASRRWPT